jgi:hypothetical protein
MRCVVLILACVIVWGGTAKPAQACTCAAPAGPAEGMSRSTAVFRGRVTEISRLFLERLGFTKTGGHRVRFAVLKQWKGPPSKNFKLITRLTSEACGFPFEEEKEYLVYAVAEPKDIQTGICTGTKNAVGADPEMKELDEIVAGIKLSGDGGSH